jgi:glycosyltransferase involved in cell wall biosynthesis
MESTTAPLVTIGIPTYNGGKRILRALKSVLNQDYRNLEIMISDNCSTDDTKDVVEGFCRGRLEIKYIRQKTNIGQLPNYSFLIKNASGKYFMWLADDDALGEGVVLKYVEFMEAHREYSVTSGNVVYWINDLPDVTERGFTCDQDSPSRRVAHFYSRVVYGGLMHGLMRRELAKDVALEHVIGNDYHFVANLVFLGKVKNFDFTGYNKSFGGVSKNFKEYAKHMGESWIVGYFPHFKIASDAFAQIMHRSPVFSRMSFVPRFVLAISSYFGVLYCYYGRLVIGARFRNHILGPIVSMLKKSPSKV